jgi:hypothetical protein
MIHVFPRVSKLEEPGFDTTKKLVSHVSSEETYRLLFEAFGPDVRQCIATICIASSLPRRTEESILVGDSSGFCDINNLKYPLL